jgi:hypothetical protein
MDTLRKIAILLLLSGLAPTALPRQLGAPQAVDHSGAAQSLQLPPAESPTEMTPTSDEREGLIHLDVAARDEKGRPLGNSTGTDLTLLQDGTAIKILSIHRLNSSDEEEQLSEVSVVLDEVDLSEMQFALAKSAAISFLRRNHASLAQPVSILWVRRDGIYASAYPTVDGDHLAQDIASGHVFPTDWKFHPTPQPAVTLLAGRDLQQGMSLRNSLSVEVLRAVYALAVKWRDKPGRKALIWIGYGWSILGELHASGGPFPVLVELSTRIREARMVIYDINPWPDPEIPVHDKIPEIDYHHFLRGVRSSADHALQLPVPHFALRSSGVGAAERRPCSRRRPESAKRWRTRSGTRYRRLS